jgi:hypothetical protein
MVLSFVGHDNNFEATRLPDCRLLFVLSGIATLLIFPGEGLSERLTLTIAKVGESVKNQEQRKIKDIIFPFSSLVNSLAVFNFFTSVLSDESSS